MTVRNKLIVVLLVSVPLAYFLFPFTCGLLALPSASVILLASIVLFGPLVAGVIVAKSVQGISTAAKFLVGLATCVVLFGSFFIVPPGATTWTLGFAANFRLTKHPAQIQKWASDVLDRYDNGKLATTTNAEYWAVGAEKLDGAEIPEFIQKLWRNKPSIGVATITDDGWFLSEPNQKLQTNARRTHCVAFSWYLTGILVGRPDFHSAWNPWYLHEIMPGIYAFHGMK